MKWLPQCVRMSARNVSTSTTAAFENMPHRRTKDCPDNSVAAGFDHFSGSAGAPSTICPEIPQTPTPLSEMLRKRAGMILVSGVVKKYKKCCGAGVNARVYLICKARLCQEEMSICSGLLELLIFSFVNHWNIFRISSILSWVSQSVFALRKSLD